MRSGIIGLSSVKCHVSAYILHALYKCNQEDFFSFLRAEECGLDDDVQANPTRHLIEPTAYHIFLSFLKIGTSRECG